MTCTPVRDTAGSDNPPICALFALAEDAHAAADEGELSCPRLYAQEANELHYPIGIQRQREPAPRDPAVDGPDYR